MQNVSKATAVPYGNTNLSKEGGAVLAQANSKAAIFMTRLSKQARRRKVSPRRPSLPGQKTGPKKDLLEKGYREHKNALNSSEITAFIPVVG